MSARIVAAAQFKAKCLRLIDEMNESREPVTITRRGKPVAVLQPAAPPGARSIIGALKSDGARYEEPFAPAGNPAEWEAAQ